MTAVHALEAMERVHAFPEDSFPAVRSGVFVEFYGWLLGSITAPPWVQEALENLQTGRNPEVLVRSVPDAVSGLWWSNCSDLFEQTSVPESALRGDWHAEIPWRMPASDFAALVEWARSVPGEHSDECPFEIVSEEERA
jgi:hypothetical protein